MNNERDTNRRFRLDGSERTIREQRIPQSPAADPVVPAAVFLGGPITCAWDGRRFEPRIRRAVETVHRTLSDFGCRVFSAHFDEDFGQSTPEDSVFILRRDLAWLERCDAAAVMYLPSAFGEPFPTPGTHVELGVLAILRKPTLLIWDETHAERYNHMVRGLAGLSSFRFLDARLVWSAPGNILDTLTTLLSVVA